MDASTPWITQHELAETDAIEQFLSAAYGADIRITSSDERLFLRHRRIEAGLFALDTAVQPADLHFTVGPMPTIVVTRSTTARLDRDTDGVQGRYGPGGLFIMSFPDRPHTTHWQSGELENCVLDPLSLDQVAAAAPGRRSGPIRFLSLDPPTPALAEQWCQVRAYVAGLVQNATAAPLLVAGAARLLAAATLATFPNTALLDPTFEDSHDASPRTLRRAMAFIDDHAADDLSAADIAAAANVTIRALRLAFRRHLSSTPTAYLRRARLAHAHADLVDADPATVTVAGVAALWGFPDQRRFAAFYRRTYGVPPRTTLQRR